MRAIRIMSALGALGLSLASAPAFAEGGNLMDCVDRGFALQKCKLKDIKQSDALIEDGQLYEGTFLVHYDFPCTGHSVQLGVQAGDSNKIFTQNVTNALVTFNGTGELHPYDLAPAVTSTLTFKPGCTLTITGVTLLPSTGTIQIWTIQAQTQSRLVDAATDRLELARDWEALSSWNVTKLTNLKDKLNALLAPVCPVVPDPDHPGDPLPDPDHPGEPLRDPECKKAHVNYTVMLNSVTSALNHQPPSATLDELRQASEDVILALQTELDQEIAIAEALSARFAKWGVPPPPPTP